MELGRPSAWFSSGGRGKVCHSYLNNDNLMFLRFLLKGNWHGIVFGLKGPGCGCTDTGNDFQ